MMRNAGVLKEWKDATALPPARKWGPQSYDYKELNLADNLNDLKSRFLPWSSGKEDSSAYIFIPAL